MYELFQGSDRRRKTSMTSTERNRYFRIIRRPIGSISKCILNLSRATIGPVNLALNKNQFSQSLGDFSVRRYGWDVTFEFFFFSITSCEISSPRLCPKIIHFSRIYYCTSDSIVIIFITFDEGIFWITISMQYYCNIEI